jgi:leader peptidase (prepilin peptidase)/N-methyltransferase
MPHGAPHLNTIARFCIMFPIQDLSLFVQALIAFPFGLIIGSFLNVVIYRVPRGESVVFPGSHCGSCNTPIKPYDNIPLLSYALLGGRCRACRAKISWVYPMVELWTGLGFFAVAYKSGITGQSVAEMLFVVVMIVLMMIDYRHQLLPNVITYPAFLSVVLYAAFQLGGASAFAPSPLFTLSLSLKLWIGIGLLVISALAFYGVDLLDNALFGKYLEIADEDEEEDPALRDVDEEQLLRQHNRVIYTTMILGLLAAVAWGVWAVLKLRPSAADPVWVAQAIENLYHTCLGALVGGGVIWLLRAIYFYTRGFGGMGLGDVKMMAIIGGFLGWQAALLVLILGSFVGSLTGVAQIVFRKSAKGMQTRLPFGVSLGLAALFALFYGQPIIAWYLTKLHP